MRSATEDLTRHGYAFIKDALSLDAPVPVHEQLMAFLSAIFEPISYCGRRLIRDVKPLKGGADRSSSGSGVFELHTDVSWMQYPPRYLALYCIDKGVDGSGIPVMADGYEVISGLSPDTVTELRESQFRFMPPPHVSGEACVAPVITYDRGQPAIRFRFDMMEPAGNVATAKFSQAAAEKCILMPQLNNSMMILDNHRMLHGRTEIFERENSSRHYLRVYGRVIRDSMLP